VFMKNPPEVPLYSALVTEVGPCTRAPAAGTIAA
jgi:hypothetical protein